MTAKLYLNNMYLKDFDAAVKSIDGDGIILDSTAFYPTGGGQPNDTGVLSAHGITYEITDVTKKGPDVAHRILGTSQPEVGDMVHGTIDWTRRYAHMRYHTAIHIMDGVVNRDYSDRGLITGSQIYEDRARVDFDLPGITRELAEEIIEKANEVVRAGHNVYAREITREEAEKIQGLARTAPGRELIKSLDTVRIIDISGFDMQADGGTHVANTREVGNIIFKGIQSKGAHNKRVEFVLS
ncbi:MAG: alanyl-tRNA editing protein [Thermoplasmataceae archaeon]